MGFFSKKKKEERILPLPEFPRLPNESSSTFYDEQINDKKDMFQKSQEFKKIIPTEDFSFEMPRSKFEKEEMDFEELAPRKSQLTFEKREDKPLFVKVDKYKESLKTVESIKTKLEEADNLLKKISRLREEEEQQLQEWQNNLEEIRQKLIKVDKNLFEV